MSEINYDSYMCSQLHKRRCVEKQRKYNEYPNECNDEWCYRDGCDVIFNCVQVG